MNAPATQLQDRPQAAYEPSSALARVLARLPQEIRAGLALLVCITFATTSPAAARAVNEAPDTFISGVGQEAINTLTDRNLSDKEREGRFRAILNRTFGLKLIARFTLGRYWHRATGTQQKEYVELVEDFIVQAYIARFKALTVRTFNVGIVRDIDDRDKIVQSALILKDGRKISIHWRVHGNSDYKIVDVLIEGVSMAVTQRDEFSSIINQRGGKIEGLLAALREKTGKK